MSMQINAHFQHFQVSRFGLAVRLESRSNSSSSKPGKQKDLGVRSRFGSPLSSKVVVDGRSL